MTPEAAQARVNVARASLKGAEAERDAAVAAAWRAGDRNAQEWAQRLGLSRQGVYDLLARAGIDLRDRPIALTPSQREAVDLVRTSGRTVASVARQAGVHRTTLHAWLRQADILTGGVPALKKERQREAVSLVQAGQPITSVARRFGVARTTVYKWVRLADVERQAAPPSSN
jgi:transposase-like protein